MTGKKPESPKNFNDCVSRDELTTLLGEQTKFMMDEFAKLTKNINDLGTQIAYVEHHHEHHEDEDDEEVKDKDGDDDYARHRERERDDDRLNFNHRGMSGNRERGNNDSFAKTKFTMIPFASNADPEAYLDLELAVKQKLQVTQHLFVVTQNDS
ncbi:unnamed protein product [Urochloa humidicola]